MANLAEVMKRAWRISRDRRGVCSFSEALRMSWAVERGFAAGYQVSYAKDGSLVRVNGFSASSAAAHSDCIEAKRWIVAAGFKPIGSHEFSLRAYAQPAAPVGAALVETPPSPAMQIAA